MIINDTLRNQIENLGGGLPSIAIALTLLGASFSGRRAVRWYIGPYL